METCYRHPNRETGVRCSNCERPICPDCMTTTSVGMRCPECARQRTKARTIGSTAEDPVLTYALIGINVLAALGSLLGGGGTTSGSLTDDGGLSQHFIAEGEYYRLITAGFLHAGLFHLLTNMLSLWILGTILEPALGSWRFGLVYFVSLLCGSFGALLMSPDALTVGASGAIFGMLGAGLILEWRATGKLAGNYMTLIVINLVFSFAFPGVSYGGHIGGLIGGLVGTVVIIEARRFRGYETAVTVAGLIAIGVLSVIVAYSKVKGLS